MNSTPNQMLQAFLRDQQPQMVDFLTRLVEYESPSGNKPALDRLGSFLAAELRQLGAQVTALAQPATGDHILARWGEGPGGALLLAHMDTVWDVGTVAQRPVRFEDGKMYGPGVEDMKGGIVVALFALAALREQNLWPGCPITLLLNTDEETGSATSRAIIEAEAAPAPRRLRSGAAGVAPRVVQNTAQGGG